MCQSRHIRVEQEEGLKPKLRARKQENDYGTNHNKRVQEGSEEQAENSQRAMYVRDCKKKNC